MLIDQHVAHERILYERALTVMDAGISNSQQLLFPHRIELKPWDMKVLEELRADLEKLGFSFPKQNYFLILEQLMFHSLYHLFFEQS